MREAGGLHVIGTGATNPAEWTTSCVVAPAVRGTGITRFFLSLGDTSDFGGDRVAGLMNAFRVEEHAD